MAERVIVRQNSQFETGFWALEADNPDSAELTPIVHIHELTPYGMLLASLGACTAIVLHTYAQHHDIPLREVALVVDYARVFQDDSEHSHEVAGYEEHIWQRVRLIGDLNDGQRERLFVVAKQCPIHKMLEHHTIIDWEMIRE